MPTVAIIIPCHNHAGFIKQAILSACNQDYPSKFIAVIDDGSTDDSYKEIISLIDNKEDNEKFVSGSVNSTPIFVLQNANGTGPSAARNKLITSFRTQAHIYAPLDADDEFLDNKISSCVWKIMEDPQRIGLVYTDHIIHNVEKDTKTYEARIAYDRYILERENIISNSPVINGLVFTKTDLYDEDLRTCEDWDLWLRITEHFYAVHTPESFQLYRVTGENATFAVNNQVWKANWHRVQQKLRQRNASK